jgi:hypothetical protein
MRTPVALFVIALSTTLAAAQSSASYRLNESAFNMGGRPEAGFVATSPAYAVTLDAIGEPLAARGLAGPSFHMDGGFLHAYPPPGEVTGLAFDAPAHLRWNPEGSAGTYSVYRGTAVTLPGNYGACLVSGLAGTGHDDASLPSVGEVFLYHVTVSNRLEEEGTLGFTSTGGERPSPPPCP